MQRDYFWIQVHDQPVTKAQLYRCARARLTLLKTFLQLYNFHFSIEAELSNLISRVLFYLIFCLHEIAKQNPIFFLKKLRQSIDAVHSLLKVG